MTKEFKKHTIIDIKKKLNIERDDLVILGTCRIEDKIKVQVGIWMWESLITNIKISSSSTSIKWSTTI